MTRDERTRDERIQASLDALNEPNPIELSIEQWREILEEGDYWDDGQDN